MWEKCLNHPTCFVWGWIFVSIVFLTVFMIFISLFENRDFSFLPPEHRPLGKRDRHDDYPWPFSRIPRSWTSFETIRPPLMILGNQNYWSHFEGGQVVSDLDVDYLRKRNPVFFAVYGPKPIPRPGEWQISIVRAEFWGYSIRLPYLAFTTKGGWHFRVGARWTDRTLDSFWNYVTWPSIAIKKLEVSQ